MKFEPLFHLRESASLDRPAWTSTVETGMFYAYKHKHTVERGKFMVQKNYFEKKFA